MKYYFGGTEIKSWRDLLISEGVPTVSLSYVGLKRRLKKTADDWKIALNYPPDQEVFLDSGAYTLNREEATYTKDQAIDLAASHLKYVEDNRDHISLVSEFDAQILGKEFIENSRIYYEEAVGPTKFMPVWHTEYGQDELEKLCSQFEVVGVTNVDIHDTSLIPLFNQVINRYGVRLHGVAITSKEMMKAVAWDSVSSMSWLTPSVFGDTIIWTGKELKRYPKAYKNQARKKHRNIFRDNGFDENKIEADDSNELLRLSLWSWQQFIASLEKRVTTHANMTTSENLELSTELVGMHDSNDRNEKLLPMIPEKRETVMIPIMGVEFHSDPDDSESEEQPYIYKRSESMRVCNTCFLREKCPAVKQDANCAYNIPIKIKTTEQLRSLKKSLIEMQTQRVLFMQMAEDLEGGYADPNLSSEMDRLSRLIKAEEDSNKDQFTITQTVTGTANKPGFFAETFGNQATEKIRQLDQPIEADSILEAEIVG